MDAVLRSGLISIIVGPSEIRELIKPNGIFVCIRQFRRGKDAFDLYGEKDRFDRENTCRLFP